MQIAAFVVAVIAVLVAGVAAWYTRGQKRAADNAVAEAVRSADAAEKAVQLQQAAEDRAAAEEERNRVDFQLENVNKNLYVLRNGGTHSAYGVYVDCGDMLARGEKFFEEFPNDHAEEYRLTRSMATTTNAISVTWHQHHDRSDERRTRRLPVR